MEKAVSIFSTIFLYSWAIVSLDLGKYRQSDKLTMSETSPLATEELKATIGDGQSCAMTSDAEVGLSKSQKKRWSFTSACGK